MAGGSTTDVSGLADTGLGDPEQIAELLRALAAGHTQG
jgi:hypothetical protein